MTKDEALEKAIWMLETIDEGKRVYETRMIAETIWACKQALKSQESLTRDWIGTALERADKDEAYRKGLIAEFAQPLSDDEIKRMYGGLKVWEANQIIVAFARAIEQAHGIGAK